MSDTANANAPTSLAMIDKSVRDRVGPMATDLVSSRMGDLLRDTEIPFEIDKIRIVDGAAMADVRLGIVITVPLSTYDYSYAKEPGEVYLDLSDESE